MATPHNIFDFVSLLGDYETVGNGTGTFANVKPADRADETSLIWISPSLKGKDVLMSRTRANLVLCHREETFAPRAGQILIKVQDPKMSFIKILREVFGKPPAWGRHHSAVIDPEAVVDPETYIGPHSYIGKARIGKGTIVRGHVFIYDNVVIGHNVLIHPGVVIGGEGFGYARDEDGTAVHFPHVGGVVIEDSVEIGSNTCIDRGTLGETVIKAGAKIDNLVHIAHNVVVGRNAFVIANAMVGGSTVIGEESWIAPSVTLRDGIVVGDRAVVGLGAVVAKSVPAGETWLGSPARKLSEFQSLQRSLKTLLNGSE